MDSKYYQSIKTNQVAELVGQNEHGSILLLPNGEERILATSTLKRWWKQVPKQEVVVEKPEVKEQQVEPLTMEVKPNNKKKKPQVESLAVPTDLTGLNKDFVEAIVKICEVTGSELFIRPSTGSYNLKKQGKIYLFFKLTGKGIVLYTKGKALEGSGIEFITVNHNFDAKILFTEWDTETYNTLRNICDLSLRYRLFKLVNKK